ncbi:MAG: LUD domain-containing protein [Calditerrivibrio sp.]|nr:LUD domain-containing protein [Calditerrivibrio sp.]
MKNSILEKFIHYSNLVSNENMIFNKEDFLNYLKNQDYDFAHLPTFDFTKKTAIGKDGINTAIVEAEAGIAETGTVVILSKDEDLRLATCLTEELHVVIEEDKITDNLESLSDFLEKQTQDESNFIAFITGASRTADIERVLTIGVHGPVKMKVFIIKREVQA